MGRRIRRIIRRTVGIVDAVTGDILDLDGSKQEQMIKQQQEAERRAIQEAERAKAEAEKKAAEQQAYEQQVAAEKDKIAVDSQEALVSDDTGVGLGGVEVDWGSKPVQGEDKLKKMLQK